LIDAMLVTSSASSARAAKTKTKKMFFDGNCVTMFFEDEDADCFFLNENVLSVDDPPLGWFGSDNDTFQVDLRGLGKGFILVSQ
jgi:hypothetical protein